MFLIWAGALLLNTDYIQYTRMWRKRHIYFVCNFQNQINSNQLNSLLGNQLQWSSIYCSALASLSDPCGPYNTQEIHR